MGNPPYFDERNLLHLWEPAMNLNPRGRGLSLGCPAVNVGIRLPDFDVSD